MTLTRKLTATIAALSLNALPAMAETTLRLGTVAPITSPWGQWAEGVAEQIKEASGGELIIDVVGDAQLGDEQEIIRQTMRGRLDMAMVSNVPLSLVGQELDILSSAFVYDTPEQGTCVAFEHMNEIVGPSMADAQLVQLSTMDVGHYFIFSKEPISSPADLEGQKLRVAATTADEFLARKFGAVGVPMGTSATIPALQTGNVEAAFLPGIFGIAIGAHTVAPHVTVTNHTRLLGTIAISERVYNSLSDQEKAWLSLWDDAGPALSATVLGTESVLLGRIEEAGIPVNYLTDEQRSEWVAAAEGTQEELAASLGDEAAAILDALNAAKAACGS